MTTRNDIENDQKQSTFNDFKSIWNQIAKLNNNPKRFILFFFSFVVLLSLRFIDVREEEKTNVGGKQVFEFKSQGYFKRLDIYLKRFYFKFHLLFVEDVSNNNNNKPCSTDCRCLSRIYFIIY